MEKKIFEKELILGISELSRIRSLLSMTGEQIKKSFNMDAGEEIVNSVFFDDDIRMDIKLVVREGRDFPCTRAYLYKNGEKVTATSQSGYLYTGSWTLEYDNNVYCVFVSEQNFEEKNQFRIRMKGGWFVIQKHDDDGVSAFFETEKGKALNLVDFKAGLDNDELSVFLYENIYQDAYTKKVTLKTYSIRDVLK